jgi:hypothetical protein
MAVRALLFDADGLAGVMGMNFQAPVFADPNNFYAVVGVMLLVAMGTLGLPASAAGSRPG